MGTNKRPQSSPKKNKDLYCMIIWSCNTDLPDSTWLHWLVVNIIGTPILRSTSLSTGNTLVPYKKNSPVATNEYHLAVFKQPDEIPLPDRIQRRSFDVKEFVDTYNLVMVSDKIMH